MDVYLKNKYIDSKAQPSNSYYNIIFNIFQVLLWL